MKLMKLAVLSVLTAVFSYSSTAFSTEYKIDPAHSTIGFEIRHLIGKVHGSFKDFSGTFVYEKDQPKKWRADAVIQVASIDTGVEKRDKHLLSKDFFDISNSKNPGYKEIKFVSKKVSDVKGNKGKLHGDLTIHGVTKPVVLDLEILGTATDPWGNKKSAFTASTTINRKDFGLTWNQALETGGFLVGDEVTINLDIQGAVNEE